MKKMNYVFSLFMAFSAASTAFAATEFSDQIKDLTNEIVKSKAGTSLLETAQQLALKKPIVLTRDTFRGVISSVLKDLEKAGQDLSKVTPELIHNIKEDMKRCIETNEADEFEILAREDAIRTNEHGKKKVRKAESSNSEAGATVKREEIDEDSSSSNSEAGATVKGAEIDEDSSSSNSEAGATVKGSEIDEDSSSSNSESGATVKREESQENQESSSVNRSTGSKPSKNNRSSDSNARKSERKHKGNPKNDPKNCVGCVNSKNNGSSDSNIRKSERTRKMNPKYSSD
jgi:hypothetical protein